MDANIRKRKPPKQSIRLCASHVEFNIRDFFSKAIIDICVERKTKLSPTPELPLSILLTDIYS